MKKIETKYVSPTSRVYKTCAIKFPSFCRLYLSVKQKMFRFASFAEPFLSQKKKVLPFLAFVLDLNVPNFREPFFTLCFEPNKPYFSEYKHIWKKTFI